MATSKSSQQRLLTIAATVVMALLAINAFLLYNKYTQEKIIEEQKTDMAEADKLKIELEKQYHEALSDLEEMRDNNDQLNEIIDRQKLELRQQKDRIDKIIREGGDFNRARVEIKNLSAQVAQYISEIQKLKSENEALTLEKDQLAQLSRQLEENLDSAILANQKLSGDFEATTNEKQQISAERNKLAETVAFASVVKVSDISVTGLKERNSGKIVKKKYAKNVEALKVCFKALPNDIVRAGLERFYIRIINPVGETLAIEELGSGVIINKATNQEIRYTHLAESSYDDSGAKEVCFNWEPNLSLFQKGTYSVEVYNKGYLSGKGSFELK